MVCKPLGMQGKIAHSLLLYEIEHRDIMNHIDFYNAWVSDVARLEGLNIDGQFNFIMSIIENLKKMSLSQLDTCKAVEEKFQLEAVFASHDIFNKSLVNR